jgi:hypothetical protein
MNPSDRPRPHSNLKPRRSLHACSKAAEKGQGNRARIEEVTPVDSAMLRKATTAKRTIESFFAPAAKKASTR